MSHHDESYVLKTPFHSRVEAACECNVWESWAGYTTPSEYHSIELEYFAARNAAGVFDLSPMTKYRVSGPDAHAYLDRLVTRDLSKLRVGRVMYCVWCNDQGQVMDDGTIFRLGEHDFRLCSQERHLDWLTWSALGFNVDIADETSEVAALALQGPTSCSVLKRLGCAGVDQLKPFDLADFDFHGRKVMVSRTGFTGDLGYELWINPDHAEMLWDQLFIAGEDFNIEAMGSSALSIARIEAGFIQAGADFVPAEQGVRLGRTRSPYELGLGWLVHLNKDHFNGRQALLDEKTKGLSRYRFVKLDVAGQKPAESSFIFNDKGDTLGTVTSAAWVPTAKRNVAFASLEMPWGLPGDDLKAEIYYLRELQWTRVMEACSVIEGPIFDPKRRRATPAYDF